MNLIKELDKIAVDPAITKSPLYFLILQEMFLSDDYTPIYLGHYEKIFNKESLNRFFEGELSYDDMLMAHDLSKLQLDNQESMFPLIKIRLEEIKNLCSPTFNEEKLIILKTIVDSINQYIPIPYLRKSLHKNELLTLLCVTNWSWNLKSVFGWGELYTAIGFKINSIFKDISELEVYLPYEEMKKLIDQLPEYQNEDVYSTLESTKKYNDKAEEMLKRINDDNQKAL